MIKKILIILIIIFTANSVFAWGWHNKCTTLKKPSVNLEFFNRFNDPYLAEYICEAYENNHDLKAAGYKVEQYRQQVKISFGQELPSLSTGAYFLGSHVPKYINTDLSNTSFVWPFIVSYEPDFFLKNHDKTKSFKKAYAASQEDEKTIYISLLSDVATSYINILQYDDLIEKQAKIVDIASQQLTREQKKFRYGTIDTTDLSVAKQNLETERNNLLSLQKQEETVLYGFATLIGISPNNTKDIKRSKLSHFEYSEKIPNEIISDVIFSRPDVMSIENQLEEAKINVRVARKELLPSFKINGIWAFNTIAQGSFFSWGNSLAAVLAGTSIDLFKGGQKVANVRLKKAMYEEMFEKYRQIDLNATKEVNNALCVIKYDTAVDNNTQSKLQYQTKIYANSQKKYGRGLIAYTELIDMNKNLIDMEQNKTKSKTIRLVNYVTLYKAVGGAL